MDSLITDAQAIYRAAVRSVQADQLFQRVALSDVLARPLTAYRRVVVVGAGKASVAMAGALERLAAGRLERGLVVVPHGYRATLPVTQRAPSVVEVVEAGHPVPDAAGLRAVTRVMAQVRSCEEEDLLIVLISGGGSALWPSPAQGLTLADVQATVRLLLRSGADIHRMNTVRKHLSAVKGGLLATAAFPATVLTLVVSDVVGDDLSVIASGPTVPDRSTYDEAIAILEVFDLWERVPKPVRVRLARGRAGDTPETPKPGDPRFKRVQTLLLGANRDALSAAAAAAERHGYVVHSIRRDVTGEARDVGADLARAVLEMDPTHPVCLLWGGETTVTVTGAGRGGRNQEAALAAAVVLDGGARLAVVLSGGTDGIDGPTDAAGAWGTPRTVAEARTRGLDPRAYLADNDAYAFFDRCGGHLKPGPTHTNVMDVMIALVQPD